MIVEASWAFGVVGGAVYTRNLRLLPDGRIGGYLNPNEKFWELDSSSLTMFDLNGIARTLFDACQVLEDGRIKLTGGFIGSETPFQHFLEEIRHPYSISTDPTKFQIDVNLRRRPRRNLVIMGANESSLHKEWARDISDQDRNWDLCLSFYGDPGHYPPSGSAEYMSRQPGTRKYHAIHRAMHAQSRFWDYERILVMDDDIRTTWGDLTRFFEICRDLDMLLAQPSLIPGCHINHAITAQRSNTLVRFTTFVESMLPCFTNEAFRQCISTFEGAFYGFGIDHLWPQILGLPRNRIGIVDAVAMEHVRPIATTYPHHLAMQEEVRFFQLYQMGPIGIRETGAVFLG